MLQSNFCPLPLPQAIIPLPLALTPSQIYLKINFRVAHSTLPQENFHCVSSGHLYVGAYFDIAQAFSSLYFQDKAKF